MIFLWNNYTKENKIRLCFFVQNNPDLGPFLWQAENIEIIFKNQHIRCSTLNLGIEKKCHEKRLANICAERHEKFN